jgi:carboxylesterase type B
MSSLVAFARTGKPDTSAIPHWAPYEPIDRFTMAVGDPFRLVRDFHGIGREVSKPYLYQDALQVQNGPLMRIT